MAIKPYNNQLTSEIGFLIAAPVVAMTLDSFFSGETPIWTDLTLEKLDRACCYIYAAASPIFAQKKTAEHPVVREASSAALLVERPIDDEARRKIFDEIQKKTEKHPVVREASSALLLERPIDDEARRKIFDEIQREAAIMPFQGLLKKHGRFLFTASKELNLHAEFEKRYKSKTYKEIVSEISLNQIAEYNLASLLTSGFLFEKFIKEFREEKLDFLNFDLLKFIPISAQQEDFFREYSVLDKAYRDSLKPFAQTYLKKVNELNICVFGETNFNLIDESFYSGREKTREERLLEESVYFACEKTREERKDIECKYQSSLINLNTKYPQRSETFINNDTSEVAEKERNPQIEKMQQVEYDKEKGEIDSIYQENLKRLESTKKDTQKQEHDMLLLHLRFAEQQFDILELQIKEQFDQDVKEAKELFKRKLQKLLNKSYIF
jgi:hypothetical protein